MPPRPQARNTRRVPGATPRDPRFVRARDGGRTAGAWRARVWTGLRVAVVSAVLLASGWYVQRVMTSGEAFDVRDIRSLGTNRLSDGEVNALLHGLRGRNIVTTDLEEWRTRLLASPWVREASLRRALPDTIEVRIVERTPMAIARAGDKLWLIDQQGSVVDEYGPRYVAIDLPIVEGLIGEAAEPPAVPDAPRVELVADALRSLREAGLLWRVSQLDVSDERNVSILLNDDPVLLRVGHEKFGERVQAYLDMGERLARMVQAVESVDLRFDNRVYVRPRKAGATFASLTPEPEEGAVAEALADTMDEDERGDGDGDRQ